MNKSTTLERDRFGYKPMIYHPRATQQRFVLSFCCWNVWREIRYFTFLLFLHLKSLFSCNMQLAQISFVVFLGKKKKFLCIFFPSCRVATLLKWKWRRPFLWKPKLWVTSSKWGSDFTPLCSLWERSLTFSLKFHAWIRRGLDRSLGDSTDSQSPVLSSCWLCAQRVWRRVSPGCALLLGRACFHSKSMSCFRWKTSSPSDRVPDLRIEEKTFHQNRSV